MLSTLQPSSTIPKISHFDWKKIMKFTFLRLKLIGLWPEGSNYSFGIYTLWSFICIVIFTFGQPFFQGANIPFILNDLQLVVATVYVTSTELLTILKAYYIATNMKVLKALISDLSLEIFQPKKEEQIEVIRPGIEFWKISTFMYWTAGNITVFFMALAPILDGTSHDRKLPFVAWSIYNTTTSPNYEITYIYQAVGVTISANTAMSSDILIAGLFMYLAAQYDILCDNIRHLCDGDKADVENNLISCVHHHRCILESAEKILKFSEWIIFGQFFISAISIGLTMFQLTTVIPLSNEFFSFLTYLLSMLLQIFLYCWFGNEVEVKSSKTAYAVFESNWTDVSSKDRKIIIILAQRCQKPLKMSALNLLYLSLETFVKILRAAWSYFALLYQLSSTK